MQMRKGEPMSDLIPYEVIIERVKDDIDFIAEQAYERGKRDILEQSQSAQPEREKGEWIVNETLINCSVCKHSAWSRHAFEDIVRGFNFCPNCGKPMKRGEQDG